MFLAIPVDVVIDLGREKKLHAAKKEVKEGRIRPTYTYSVQLTRPGCRWHFFLRSWRTVIHFCRSSMATCLVVYKGKFVLEFLFSGEISIVSSYFNSPLQSKLKPSASVDQKCHHYCQASNVELPVTISFFNVNPPRSVVNAEIRFWKQ